MTKTKAKIPALPMPVEFVERRIYLIRGQKVMLDSDLAELYQVPTKRLNEAVRRNADRFPGDFMFQLTASESQSLRFQFGTSSLRSQIATLKKNARGQHRKYSPYAFTEQGVAMLSSVLNSKRAVQVNIVIMRTFVKLREILATHKDIDRKLETLERKYQKHDVVIKQIFEAIRKLMTSDPVPPSRRIGFAERN